MSEIQTIGDEIKAEAPASGDDAPVNPIITEYLANVDAALADRNGDISARSYLNIQLTGWDNRLHRLEGWARSKSKRPCPFPLDAFEIAQIQNALRRRLGSLASPAPQLQAME